MAMNVGTGGGDNEVMVEMNTTPLIDVMLVLLVMLIITIPIQTHAVKLNMPNPNAKPPTVQPVVHTLAIDFDGTISWDGTTIPDMRTLEARFTQVAHGAVREPAAAPREASPGRSRSCLPRSVPASDWNSRSTGAPAPGQPTES